MPRILFADLKSFTPLPAETALRVSSGDLSLRIVNTEEEAIKALSEDQDIDVFVSNSPNATLFKKANPDSKTNPNTVLVTDLPMHKYSEAVNGKEDQLISHVIANRPDSAWTTHDLRATLQKIATNDIFGISKYLTPNTQIQTAVITCSADREPNNKAVMDYAASHNLGQHTCRSIFGITEELLMNAIYDAPVAGGRTRYNDLPRSTQIILEDSEYSTLKFGFDGSIFAISVTDPFGAFKRHKLFEYVKKVLMRRDSNNLIDNKKGGAGLGIFKILYSSHGFVCNIQMGAKTEIVALIDTHHILRDFSKMTRSIHYFEQKT